MVDDMKKELPEFKHRIKDKFIQVTENFSKLIPQTEIHRAHLITCDYTM